MASRYGLGEDVKQLLAEITIDLTGDVSIILPDEAAPPDHHNAGARSPRYSPGAISNDALDVATDVAGCAKDVTKFAMTNTNSSNSLWRKNRQKNSTCPPPPRVAICREEPGTPNSLYREQPGVVETNETPT